MGPAQQGATGHGPSGPRALVVSDEAGPPDLAARLGVTGPADLLVDPSEEQLDRHLARMPGVALVVDARTIRDERQFAAWRYSFFHVDDGGAWVMAGPADPQQREEQLVARLRTVRDRGTPLAASIADVEVTGDRITVRKGGRHLLKVWDAECRELLATREPEVGVTLLDALAPQVFDPRITVTSHGAAQEPYPATFAVPRHELRRYEGSLYLPRTTLVHTERSVLPDSFRWHLMRNPWVSGLRHVRNRFGIPDEQTWDAPVLPGSYFHFGYNHPGHFGHLMTEAIARLWGWPRAKAEDPDLKILCRLNPDPDRFRPAERRLETRLLPAFGIDPGDVVWVREPVRVESLVGATPMWHNAEPYYVHPGIRDVWGRLRRGLDHVEPPAYPRIFVTRPPSRNRPCRNGAEVEAFFAARGFEVIEPSRLSVPEQAAVFAGAEVIAGFGGSAMFNLVYAERVRHLVVLNHTAYVARNELMFAAAHGADAHFFWSPPDQDHPEDGFSQSAFQSSWAFDFAANGAALARLLDEVG